MRSFALFVEGSIVGAGATLANEDHLAPFADVRSNKIDEAGQSASTSSWAISSRPSHAQMRAIEIGELGREARGLSEYLALHRASRSRAC